MKGGIGAYQALSIAMTGVGLFALFVIALTTDRAMLPRRATLADPTAMMARLKEESRAIGTIPGSIEVDKSASARADRVSIGADFAFRASYQDLRKYFDAELAGKEWEYCREERLEDWGEDLGGMIAYYRKEDLRASLQFAGERANYGWDYSLVFKWDGWYDDCR